MTIAAQGTASQGSPARERPAGDRWRRLARPAFGLLLPVALAVAWEFIVRMGWASGRLAPPPSVIFATFVDLARTGELQRDTLVTLGRVAAGFGIGVVVATIAGAATGYSATLRGLLDPSLQALRAIPSIAWIPLFILWLGIFEASKVTLIALGVFISGLYLRAWKLCAVAAFLAVAVPIVAWVERAALLLLIIAGGLIALGFAGWWAQGREARQAAT